MHQFAAKASQASQCAKEQGKFWEMNEKLFSNQGKLSVADLKQHAVDLGLKADQFNQCLDSDKYQKDIQKDMDDASKYGVSSTPSFFINGRPFVGARPLDGFVQVINEELERAGVPIPPPPPAPAPTAAAPAPATPPPGLKVGDPKVKPEVADKADKKDDKKGDPKGDKP